MNLKYDKNGRAILDDELFELFTRYINQGDNREDNLHRAELTIRNGPVFLRRIRIVFMPNVLALLKHGNCLRSTPRPKFSSCTCLMCLFRRESRRSHI